MLREFCRRINPGGAWKAVFDDAERAGEPIVPEAPAQNIPRGLIASLLGCFAIYLVMFGTGRLIFGDLKYGIGALALAAIFTLFLIRVWNPRKGEAKPQGEDRDC